VSDKQAVFGFRCSTKFKRKLDLLAAHEETTISAWLRRCITKAFEKLPKHVKSELKEDK
jgi:predicted transcriptional regulator